jgi:hypothetical protein
MQEGASQERLMKKKLKQYRVKWKSISWFRFLRCLAFTTLQGPYENVSYVFCGLVVGVLGYRSRGLGSIPGTIRYSEKWVWNGVHSASWVQLRSYLEDKVAALV